MRLSLFLLITFLLSGCLATTLDNFSHNNLRPSEEITIRGPEWCGQETIHMDALGYTIKCNNVNNPMVDNIMFEHSYFYKREVNILNWFGISYEDNNCDQLVDQVIVNNSVFVVNRTANNVFVHQTYRNILNELQQPKINRIWSRRWVRN